MPVRKAPIIIRGPESAAIRAFRAEQREQALQRQYVFLGRSVADSAVRLARALRAERRAAFSGQRYNIARHCALLRIARQRTKSS